MVVCEGRTESDEPRICFCFSRQVRGCDDPTMKVSKRPRDEIKKDIAEDNLIW